MPCPTTRHPSHGCGQSPAGTASTPAPAFYADLLLVVERSFSELTTRRLRPSTLRSVLELEAAIRSYLAEHKRQPKPFIWSASADLILGKVKHICKQLLRRTLEHFK